MATKHQMLKAIYAANKRIQRLEKAGFTKGDAYSKARAQIAKSRGESPFHMKHSKLSQTGDLKAAYKAAQNILKESGTRVGVVKQRIHIKRNKTFQEEKGITDTSKAFYNFLNSDAFKHMSEVVGSDQVLRIASEARDSGAKWGTIKNRIDKYMKQQPDKYYIEDIQAAITGEKKSAFNEIDWDELPF